MEITRCALPAIYLPLVVLMLHGCSGGGDEAIDCGTTSSDTDLATTTWEALDECVDVAFAMAQPFYAGTATVSSDSFAAAV